MAQDKAPNALRKNQQMADRDGNPTRDAHTVIEEMWRQVVAGFVIVPCEASGTNSITLTPRLHKEGGASLGTGMAWSFVAVATSSGAVTAVVGTLPSKKVYKNAGATQAGSGDIVSGGTYLLIYDAALDSAAGGFVMIGRALDATLTALAAAGTLDPQGRLTLTTAVPVTVSDVTAAGTIYYTPYCGRLVPIHDGTEFDLVDIGGELSLALDSDAGHTGYHQSGKLFDLFIENSTGTPRLVTGPAWTNTTTRAQAISRVNGVLVNTASMVAKFDTSANTVTVAASRGLYVGTAYMSAGAQTDDSAALRHLWNMYNRVPRKLFRKEGTDTWSYSTASFQQANASAANQVAVVRGVDEDNVLLHVHGIALNSTATARSVGVAIGLDSTSAKAADCITTREGTTSAIVGGPAAAYSGFPGLGYHTLVWLELGAGADAQTWFGDNGGALFQSGMAGVCVA